MKPITQTRLGHPEGNCWHAALASVLELPLSALPDYPGEGADWWKPWEAWLCELGLGLLFVLAGDNCPIPAGYSILAGKSPRGDFNHAVVVFNGHLRHDPYPAGGGVTTKEDYAIVYPHQPWSDLHVRLLDRLRMQSNSKEQP